MKLYFLVFFAFFSIQFGLAQENLPQDYFESPLEIPLILSGTFGELRSNHFHSGMDIKTHQQTGLSVVASASGYVSRIKISHFGYGKALYIQHPNGYTSVYAHLKEFAPEIEKYIKEGPTQDELIATKKNIIGGFPLRIDSNSKILSYVVVIGYYKLPLDYLDTFNQNVEEVTIDSIKDAFKRRLSPEKFVTVSVGKPLPEQNRED